MSALRSAFLRPSRVPLRRLGLPPCASPLRTAFLAGANASFRRRATSRSNIPPRDQTFPFSWHSTDRAPRSEDTWNPLKTANANLVDSAIAGQRVPTGALNPIRADGPLVPLSSEGRPWREPRRGSASSRVERAYCVSAREGSKGLDLMPILVPRYKAGVRRCPFVFVSNPLFARPRVLHTSYPSLTLCCA
ncbi:hypothetical protein PYCCODRAFT_1260776 [Trametes coccinea BRFM310]|uniref:Uncharacterized protein n=1 Tax=Trametes coccinea (strain BRFM310) TaxID=1353009 RepID=A0A1Y2I682_TRAC3|nr:hypothetical protein PYCCODRAFT_1260776 [Trametes coccinea BRFM310]